MAMMMMTRRLFVGAFYVELMKKMVEPVVVAAVALVVVVVAVIDIEVVIVMIDADREIRSLSMLVVVSEM